MLEHLKKYTWNVGPYPRRPRFQISKYATGRFEHALLYSVGQKIPPEDLWHFFCKTAGNFSIKFYVPIMRSYLR